MKTKEQREKEEKKKQLSDDGTWWKVTDKLLSDWPTLHRRLLRLTWWPLTSANHLFSERRFCFSESSNRLQMILHLMSLLFYFHQIFCFFLLFVFGSYFPPFLLFSSVPGDLWENLQALVFSHRSGGQSRAPPAGGAGKLPFIHFCFSLPLKEESQ